MTHPPLSGWSLNDRDPEAIQAWLKQFQWFHDHYFQVESDGWDNLPAQGPALVVGSHNGGLASPDMMMTIYEWFTRFGTDTPTYGLMHPQVWFAYPPLAQYASQLGAIRANPRMAIPALQRGAYVLVYPGGGKEVFRPYWERDRVKFYGNQGFIKLALREQVPIVPIVSWGAHETLFVLADLYDPIKELFKRLNLPWLFNLDPEVFPIYLGLPWGIAVGPLLNFPLPANIHLRIGQPITFERYGREAAQDFQYVDQCYQFVLQQMQSQLNQLIAEKAEKG